MKKLTLLAVALLLLTVAVSSNTVPELVSYQGILTAPDGTPLNGTFDIVARIFDDSTGGTLITEFPFPTTPVDMGQVQLAIPVSYPDLAPWSGTSMSGWEADYPRFLELVVEGDMLSPRTRLTSTPYAMAARGLAHDLFTSPGRLYIVPNGPPVSDCTYVPLEIAVDSAIARMRFRGIDPAIDCTYVPLELSVDLSKTRILLQPPGPITPVDSVEPAITMSVDPTQARLWVMGVEPQPFKAAFREPDINLFSDVDSSTIILGHAGNGTDQPPSLQMLTGIGTGLEIIGFNPQPEPPQPIFAINASPSNGMSIRGFNPQPEPPGLEDPTLEITGGLGDTGPGIFMFNPQPEPPGAPPFLVGLQTGPAGAMFDMQSEPGLAKAPGGINHASMHADTTSARINVNNEYVSGGGTTDSQLVYISASLGLTELQLRSLAAGSSTDIRMQIDGDGAKVGIGTASPSEALHVVGNICYTGSIGACSDARFKTDVTTLENSLEKVTKLRGVEYRWKQEEYPDQAFDDKRHLGFVAQEVEKLYPEMVMTDEHGYKSVDYSRLTPVLVEAIKEQQKEIDELKSMVQQLVDRSSNQHDSRYGMK